MSRGVNKTPGRKTTPPNAIQDSIEVFCRVRPLANNEESCVEILSDSVLQINAPKNLKTIQSRVEQMQCTFNKIFTTHVTQQEIFQQVGLPLVQDLLTGKNALCFMYGITGSGKTFTMNGEPTNGGVLPRCLDTIFNSINHLQTPRCVFKGDGYNGFCVLKEEDAKVEAEKKYSEIEAQQKNVDIYDTPRLPDTTILEVDEDNNYAIFVSFVEIYNNSVFDLLEKSVDKFNQPKPPGSKILREDQKRNMFVYEVTELEIKNTEEAFTLFWMGQQRRKTAHTLLNTESSRSHCVFTIKLVQAPLGPNGETIIKDQNLIRISQISLCDLAGSERVSRTKTEGEKVRQAGHINNSLMTLRACIESLRENQKNQDGGNKMVPYRDSKLTHLFKNYFDGDGKVRMVVCLNPRTEDFDESVHVMRFAEMTQEVKVARSEAVKFDLGLTPGRGKANKQFKLMTHEDMLSSDTASQEDILPPVQQFAPWPLCLLSGYNDCTTLLGLMHYLEERIKLRETLYGDWNHKQMEVRRMILQLEQDNGDLTKAMDDQRTLLSDKEKESKSYEKRIRTLNEKYETLQKSSHSFELQKRQLTSEVEKYKDMVHKERQEKLKIKQTLKDLTSNERLRWEKECDKRVHDKQIEMEGQVLVRNEKLRQLRDVVQNLQLPEENQVRLNQIISEGRQSKNTRVHNETLSTEHIHEKYKTSDHTSDSKQTSEKSKKAPSVHPKPRTRTTWVNGNTSRSKPKVRSKSPPASLSRKYDVAPVRGAHRRSRSSDFWLHHKPSDTLHTDTVMQPNIRSKKTVKTPNVRDLKVIPNYILTHQEEDSAGEIETKLIKGDVLPTRGGGSSVQFTDIEILKKTLEERAAKKLASKPPKAEKSEKIVKTTKTSSKTPSKSNGRKRKSDGDDGSQSEDNGMEGKTEPVKHKKLKS